MGTPFKNQKFEKFFFHSRENQKKTNQKKTQSQSQIFMSLQGPQLAHISVNNRKGYIIISILNLNTGPYGNPGTPEEGGGVEG